MFNVQAVVLKMLLASEQKQIALETFSKLHKDHFNDAFSSIYQAVQNYYKKYNAMPSIDALMLEANRNARLSQALVVLANTQIPEVSMEQALEVLEAEYTQDLFLKLLETDVLQDLTMLDQGEILNRVASLHLKLEEKVTNTGKVFNADNMRIFQREEDTKLNLIALGICNEFDAQIGLARTETLLLGGWRGTGKSIICSNIQVQQYLNGDIAPYFSIEMKEHEVFRRNLAMLAGVSALAMRNNTLEGAALLRLARTRARMFNGGEELFDNDFVKQYTMAKMSDFYDMESKLMKV
ncbi:putative replicative DNA helicase [Klebsiella phage vB_Kpn_3]|nr:putative replicative DNA helicase [Klebsiella phage vB_Kpn_3]